MSTVETPQETRRSFFTVGGTLPANAPSYVERKADTDLFTHLMEGHFCYVLTSRQVGKSSLMVRTAIRLRQAGRRVAVLDLTKIGMNLSAEQWYDGLLVQLGREFRLEEELDRFWTGSDAAIQRMGPMQRWMTALRQVILPSVSGHLVIFIDEIDAVRGLPFATDEFFAGIRQVYNNRTEDPELNRLTFCLIGVATPADLIRNVSTTPFNIGNRVVLTDFTEKEAEPLMHGLGREPVLAFRLLRRILWWTNGHPYLTQRLCAAVAGDPKVTKPRDVDRICDDLFLSARARESDDNLLFVRERILRKRGDDELSGLLDLYGLIHAGKNVAADDNNPLIDILRLAGLVTARENRLVVRNRIYEHVFDDRWIRMNMPDAELRRQRAAYRKGVLRTAALAAIVLLVIAVLELIYFGLRQKIATQDYAAHVIQVQQDFDSGDYASGVEAMRETQHLVRTNTDWLEKNRLTRPFLPFILRHPLLYAALNGFDQKVDERFEWDYLRARLFGDGAYFYRGNTDEVRSVALSPDGAWLATASADSTVRIFDIRGFDADSANHPMLRCALAVLGSQAVKVGEPSYSYLPRTSDPKWSVNRELDVKIRDLNNKLQSHGLGPWQPPGILSVAFSPQGTWLAIATGTWNAPQVPGTAYLVSTASLCSGSVQVVQIPTQHTKPVDTVIFRNEEELASTSEDNTAEFWRIVPGETVKVQREGTIDASATTTKGMNAAAFSPDRHTFAMAFGDGHFCTAAMSPAGPPLGQGDCGDPVVADVSGLMSMAFYDNNLVLLGTRDGRVVRADLQPDGKTWRFRTFLETGQGLVTSLTISQDRTRLLTTGSDGTVLVWKLVPDEHNSKLLLGYGASQMLRGAKAVVYTTAISRDQRVIVSGGADAVSGTPDGRVYFWTRQPKPDGALNPDVAPGAVDPPSVSVVCGGQQVKAGVEPTWSSQPAFLRACGSVQALAYSPDGDRIAGLVGVTQRDHLKLPGNVSGRPATIFIQPLAKSALDANDKNPKTGKLWVDPGTGMPIVYPQKPDGDPLLLAGNRTTGVALAWQGNYLAAAENDKNGYCGTVQMWDVSGRSPVSVPLALPRELSEDCYQAPRIVIAKPGQGQTDGTYTITDSGSNYTGTPAQVSITITHGVLTAAKLLTPGSGYQGPATFAVSEGGTPGVLAEQQDSAVSLAFLGDGTLVAGLNQTNGGTSQAMMIYWKPADWTRRATPVVFSDLKPRNSKAGLDFKGYGKNSTLTALAFSRNGRWMAVCGSRSTAQSAIQIWNVSSGLDPSSLSLEENLKGTEHAHSSSGGLQGQCSAVAFSPDSRWFAAGTRSYDVAVWSTGGTWDVVEGQKVTGSLVETRGDQGDTSNQIYYIPSPPMANAAINTLTFSPDSRRLAYGTADSKIILWHVVAQVPLPILNVHSGGVVSLAFSPSGQCLASGSSDQTLRFSCDIDPAILHNLQSANLAPTGGQSWWQRMWSGLWKPHGAPSTASLPPSDRPEGDNWIQFAQ